VPVYCECVIMCVCLSIYIMCVWLLGTAFRTRLVRSVPIAGDSYLCPLCTRYAGDSKKTNNQMIQRFIPVRAVKIRRRFEFKTASFHVSVCSCIIFLIIIASLYIYMLIISFHLIVWYFWPVDYRTITYDISDRTPYVSSWYEYLLVSFHVLVIHRCWPRPSIDIP